MTKLRTDKEIRKEWERDLKTKTTLKNLIESHSFNWVNDEIEKHFTLEDVRGEDYKLYHFDRSITSKDAIKKMKEDGYIPANLHELLLWKKWNNNDWVVALGSVGKVDGSRRVPCLSRVGSKRDLRLGWWGDDWGSSYRFLAVRNSALKPSEPLTALEPLETLTLESAIAKVKEAGYVIYKPI